MRQTAFCGFRVRAEGGNFSCPSLFQDRTPPLPDRKCRPSPPHRPVFAAGIFANENGQRFLTILIDLADRGFRGLYDKCRNDIGGHYYQTGLKRVTAWSNDVIQEDIDFVTSKNQDIHDTYRGCFADYVQDRFGTKKRASVRLPPTVEFVRRFFECVGQHEALATGEYFSKRDTVLQRIACMDAARQALYTLVATEGLRVELESRVSSVPPTPAPSR